MDLEKEIALLKEKVALLEKVKDLQEMGKKAEADKVYVHYPAYLTWPYQEPWRTTWGDTTAPVAIHPPNITISYKEGYK